MNKSIWFTTVVILFMVLFFPVLSLLLVKMVPGNDQPGFSGHVTKVVYGKIVATQTFVSIRNNLTAVGLSIKNPSNANNKSVFVQILDGNNNLLRTGELNGYSIQDGTFVKFVFEPIVDSKNKEYTFKISSPDATDKDSVGAFWDEKVGIPAVYYFKPQSRLEIIKEGFSDLFSRLRFLDY